VRGSFVDLHQFKLVEMAEKDIEEKKDSKKRIKDGSKDDDKKKRRKMNERRQVVMQKKKLRQDEADKLEKENGDKKVQVAEVYLKLWRDNRAAWKFSKATQIWLLKHMFDRKKLSKNIFKPYMEEYLRSIKGGAVARIMEEAEKELKSVLQGNDSLEERLKRLQKKMKGDAKDPAIEVKVKDVRSRYKRAKLAIRVVGSVDGDQESD